MAEADWKRIQKKTFTRWCNEHLRHCGMIVEDLAVDLCDGLKLIALLKVLSRNSKAIRRYNKKPKIRAQKLENVQVALDFIASEKVKLVNIGTSDIVDSNMKLILGLIWTLILHYQISMGFGLNDESQGRPSTTPKQALLNFVNEKVAIPNKQVKNFTTDWNDGTLIAALVDSTAPGLCPEHVTMEPQNALENASHAMKLAEDWLGVPQLLQPEDLVNPHVDELSVMTYISMFPEAELKEGAPLKSTGSDASKVKVYGSGVEPEGISTDDATAEFTVDVRDAGVGKLTINVEGPEGQEEVFITDKKDGTFACSYVPNIAGTYTIKIYWSGQPVPGSPFVVNVSQGSDATVCKAYGPGLEGSNLKEGCETEFWVETEGAGEGTLSLSIRGPKGPVIGDEYMHVEDEGSGKYHIFYTPPSAGQYIIEILFGGLHVDESPYKVHITQDLADPSKCRAEGDGITGKDLAVGKPCTFWVYTKGAGRGDLGIHIRNKSGQVGADCKKLEDGMYEYTYMPEEDGEYVITVKYGGENIPGSRFKVNVEPPTDPSKCIASGPGLEPQGVRVDIPTKFEVRTKGAGHGNLEVAITGPDGNLEPQCSTSPYTYDYTYEAKVPGIYTIDAKFSGEHIPNSPFTVAVTDTNKVRMTGPGMKGEFLPINEPLEYFIDAREAGPGKVGCSVQGPMRPEDYDQSAPKITDNGDGTFYLHYTPVDAGRLKMNVTFAESAIPDTPIKLYVYDASQVLAEGKGLEDGNISGKLTTFGVDMRRGGEGHLLVSVDGPSHTPVTVKDQANNMVKCEYIPFEAGEYNVSILWEGVHIPNSPFHITVRPAIDPSAVLCYGEGVEGGNLMTDMWAEFFVDYKKAGKGEPQIQVQGPGGGEELETEIVEEGLSKVRYYIDPEEAGEYKVEVLFADQPVPGSPFKVNTAWKTDPSKVKAFGPGLEGGIASEWVDFTIDMSKAGNGNLDVSIEGPTESEAQVDDKGDGTAVVKYNPSEPGEYTVNVSFANENIPGSPFCPVFLPCTDSTKVNVYGPGIQLYGVKVGDPGDFVIDTSKAGVGALDVYVDGPNQQGSLPRRASTPVAAGSKVNARRRASSFRSSARAHVSNNQDGTFSVQYNPRKIGPYHLSVSYDGIDVPNSPFLVNVCDPSKVTIKGPGIKGKSVQCVNDPLVYAVDTSIAGIGELAVTIDSPEETTQDADVKKTTESNYVIKYTPSVIGPHKLNVEYAMTAIPKSPVEVEVVDPNKVVVSGDCFDTLTRVETPVLFTVNATEAGEGELEVNMEGPARTEVTSSKQDDGTVDFEFYPNTAGEYQVDFSYSGKPVPGSPHTINVYDPTMVTARGPGITGEGTRVGEPAKVIVDTTNAGSAPLSVTVKFPNGEESTLDMQPEDETPGILTGQYFPEDPGYYSVQVAYNEEPIHDSPFEVAIVDPKAVEVKPPEVDKELVAEWVDGFESSADLLPIFATVDEPTVVDIYTDAAGPGKLDAKFKPMQKNKVPVDYEFEEVEPDHYHLVFTPHEPTNMELDVLYNGFETRPSQKIVVSDPKACTAYGPGLQSGIFANEETHFYVDTKNAGPGMVGSTFSGVDGVKEPCNVEPCGDNKYKVSYTPTSAGDHTVVVEYAKGPIKDSPFTVGVCDPFAVKAFGKGLESATVNKEAEFTVDATEAGEGALGILIEGPEETNVNCVGIEDGTFKVTYVPNMAGNYKVIMKFANVEVPGSPFPVRVERPPPDASKCIVSNIDETPGSFFVDACLAGGNGLLEVCAAGEFLPANSVTVDHMGKFIFNVKYDVTEKGETTINVKWHGDHVPGSPFSVYI